MKVLSSEQRERFADAIARVGHDEELLVMLSRMVAEDGPVLLSSLRDKVAAADLTAVVEAGHSLKGMLSTYETGSPVAELQSIIDAARTGDDEVAKGIMEKQYPLLVRFITELQQLAGCAAQEPAVI